MKKLIAVSILLALLSTAAFAEFRVSFMVDITQDVFSGRLWLDDYTDNPSNDGTGHPGGYNRGPGTVDFFTNNNATGRRSEININLDYVLENFQMRLQFTPHRWINGRHIDGNTDAHLTRGNNAGSTLDNLLTTMNIGDYYVQGNMGNLYGYFGNSWRRGAASSGGAYDVFNARRYTTHSPAFGYITQAQYDADSPGDAFLRGVTEIRVPFRLYGVQLPGFEFLPNDEWSQVLGGAYMLLGARFLDGFSFEIAGGRNTNTRLDTDGRPLAYASGGSSASDDEARIAFGARFSGVKVLDLFNFDVMYNARGGDPTMNAEYRNYTGSGQYTTNLAHEDDGRGMWDHRFGVYADFSLLDNALGLGIGYTGRVVYQENINRLNTTRRHPTKNEDLQLWHPWYNGIDVKLRFATGPITIVSNNNISFAHVQGNKDFNMVGIYGGGGGANDNRNGTVGNRGEQSFLGLTNSISFGYQMSDNLDIVFQAINWAQWNNAKATGGTRVMDTVSDVLGLTVTSRYAINRNFAVMGGLAARIDHHTQKDIGTAGTGQDALEVGRFYFGIPITFQVNW